MIRPGPRNALTDVAGLTVGSAEDVRARTGVTVVLPGLLGGGGGRRARGAPGTINTDALRPGGLIRELHGLVLSGGSAFGLEAATGLMAWLAVRGRGFADWGPCIPVVAGAILFDLANGGDKGWGELPPYRRAGAGRRRRGGRGGPARQCRRRLSGPSPGGSRAASARRRRVDEATGVTVAALVAVNPWARSPCPAAGPCGPGTWSRRARSAARTRHGGHRPRLRDQARPRHQHDHRRRRDRRSARSRRPAAAGRHGRRRLRLRHPPDPHAAGRRHRVRAGDRGGGAGRSRGGACCGWVRSPPTWSPGR